MSLFVTEATKAGIPQIEPGTYPAVCYGLVDLGEQYNKTYDRWYPKILVMWELPTETVEIDGEQKSRVMSKQYTVSLNEKASLRKDLISWRGRDFTAEELAGFDLRNIVGAPCLLNVVRTDADNGKSYANVAAIMKLPKGMTAPVGDFDPLVFDLDTSELARLDSMPEWIANKIKESRTYQERVDSTVPDDYAEDEEEVPF